jgi:hypothetical protein
MGRPSTSRRRSAASPGRSGRRGRGGSGPALPKMRAGPAPAGPRWERGLQVKVAATCAREATHPRPSTPRFAQSAGTGRYRRSKMLELKKVWVRVGSGARCLVCGGRRDGLKRVRRTRPRRLSLNTTVLGRGGGGVPVSLGSNQAEGWAQWVHVRLRACARARSEFGIGHTKGGRSHLHPLVAEHPPHMPRPIRRPHAPPAPSPRARVAAGQSGAVAPAPPNATTRSVPPWLEAGVPVVGPDDARPARAGIRTVEGWATGLRGRVIEQGSPAVVGVVGAAAALDACVGRRGGCARRTRALGCRGCLRPTARPPKID